MWEERGDTSWSHWFQDTPDALIDRVERAAKRFRYSYEPIDGARILVFGGQAGDVLEISATRDDVSARVEINGRSVPDVTQALRQALEPVE